jgi:hypothetical protein
MRYPPLPPEIDMTEPPEVSVVVPLLDEAAIVREPIERKPALASTR